MKRDWVSWNREYPHLSPRDLAEIQVASLDAETIREYAVCYAAAMNERTRRGEVRNVETRAAAQTFTREADDVTPTATVAPAISHRDLTPRVPPRPDRRFTAYRQQESEIERTDRMIRVNTAMRKYASEREAIVSDAIAKLSRRLVLDLRPDFLKSEIVIGGARVQWGKASVTQLTSRRDTLARGLEAETETVARLDVAIAALRDSGAKNLNELAAKGTKQIGRAA